MYLAEDETSMYLQATTTSVWAPRGQTPVVYAAPGRERTCFYGALNLERGEVVALRSPVMNAVATAQYLQQILTAIPEAPIFLLWDRAPWHSGPPVREVLAENPRLEVMSLPVAAPDLNPQEQVWKATRRAVSHNHTHKRLSELADRFEEHLKSHTFESSFLDRYDYQRIRPMFM